MTRKRSIMCAVDFSEFSRHALECAVRMARSNTMPVVALHVLANWPAVDVVPSLRSETLPKISLKDVDRKILLRHLQTFVEPYAGTKVKIEARVSEGPDVH